ncbi:MAG TPA: histidine kinase [Bryobacteraceae bacterium]|nr:histidine kinase [Bryobacteraceae bacterium]
MPDWLSIHKPLLVNTIGHCAGALIFGMLLYLFLLDWRGARDGRNCLPMVAAALAMLWNLGSLVGLATGPNSGMAADIIVAAAFSVLSLLPAVLLHISLGSRHRPLWLTGYVLSTLAAALHVADLLTHGPRFHQAALLLVTAGFGLLTVVSVLVELRQENGAAGSRLAASMVLFLFAISFVHFSTGHAQMAWSKEVALHHAGLPLAIFVLLQDYRFLLLDAFLRFIVNATLAAGALLVAIRVAESHELRAYLLHPFDAGLLFVSACLLLALFVYLRNRIQKFLTRVLFLRSNVEEALLELQQLARATRSEDEYTSSAAEAIGRFLRASRVALVDEAPLAPGEFTAAAAVAGLTGWNGPAWALAVLPLRFSRGDARYLLLGQRAGGRRYLSEDFEVLTRLGAALVEHVEQLRGMQMRALVSQAELKALQAQINPHFLFNSLNTLYGTIDRSNTEARQLVVNLSEVFRYLLRSERTFIEIEEELRIVRAYLQIEELRLGPRLQTELNIDASALRAAIPLLSIQPLVENAVKHGVAAGIGTGFVRLTVRSTDEGVAVEVANSGECDTARLAGETSGIGLANVRRRLALCYGEATGLHAAAVNGVTTVGFTLPRSHMAAAV